jgi:hypothetical protein
VVLVTRRQKSRYNILSQSIVSTKWGMKNDSSATSGLFFWGKNMKTRLCTLTHGLKLCIRSTWKLGQESEAQTWQQIECENDEEAGVYLELMDVLVLVWPVSESHELCPG